jgi:NADH:ubiquinone oxidoreductase subunit 5 (subunit L)/multisubunit Na+/H+ antiporter MnhA subunit
VAGIWLARRWYVERPESPARFVERFPLGLGPGMYRASANRYYIDDFYQLVWARGGVLLSNALWWFDAKVIDGAVNGAGWLARTIGGGLRKTQTGRVENYGLGIAAGLAIVLLVYATVVR